MYTCVHLKAMKGIPVTSNKRWTGISLLGTHQKLISQLLCGACSGHEESENRNLVSLSLSLCWFSSCSSGDPDWATETEEAGKEENKKWEWGRQKSEALKFQIRLLYSDAGGEWFQAADNGPTESILTFSLVIAEFAGWGQWLDLC